MSIKNTSQLHKAGSSKDLKLLVVVLTGALVFIMAARTPLDTDFWWHIRAGEVSWQSGAPLLTDLFTFTRLGQTWINHSWLAEIMYYLAYQGAGFFGVGLLVALLAVAAMMLVFAQLEGPDLLKPAVIILASTVAAPVWSPRPQLFSLVLFAGVYLILDRYRRQGKDRLWLMPILFILWSNLHAGYTLGFLLIGVVIAGEILNSVLQKEPEKRLGWSEIRKIFFWSLVCLAVVLINPNGLATWLVPFKTVRVEALRQLIDEWASPDFHQLYLQPFLWMLFAVFTAIGLSRRRIDGVDLVGVIGFGYLALLAKRNFAPFALFSAPVVARYCWAVIQSWREERQETSRSGFWQKITSQSNARPLDPRLRRVINLLICALLCFAGIAKLAAATQSAFVEQAAADYFPVEAVNHLKTQNPGRLFNSYGWGGYIEWNLHEFPVFIDGRTDLFGDEIISEWLNTMQAQDGWQDTFYAWDIRYCLIESDNPLAGALKNEGAEVLYEDQNSVLFKVSE